MVPHNLDGRRLGCGLYDVAMKLGCTTVNQDASGLLLCFVLEKAQVMLELLDIRDDRRVLLALDNDGALVANALTCDLADASNAVPAKGYYDVVADGNPLQGTSSAGPSSVVVR